MALFNYGKQNLIWSRLVLRKSSVMKKPGLTGSSITKNSMWDAGCRCPLKETFLSPKSTEKTSVNKSGSLTDCC